MNSLWRKFARRSRPDRAAANRLRASRLIAEALEPRILLTWTGATSGTTNDSAHLYNNTANWAGGIIDDSFSGVTFTANTVLYFNAARTTSSTGLNLGYSGNFSLTLESSTTTAEALTLGGNISGPAVTQAVTLGNATNPLNVALGTSARAVTLSTGTSLVMQNVLSGTTSLTESGGGALTLAGANTNSGGVILSGGQLNINSATALGTSRLTIDSGTIDNTSGAAVTLSGSVLQTWAGNFTFAGTNSLTMGSGAVTLGSSITITTSAGMLADSGIIGDGGSGYSITKAGAGTLTLAGVNTFSGGTILSTGQLNINNTKAIGTGTFTINGGTIDNTTGSSITLGNNAQTWAGSFTFTGTSALNLGTGAITLAISPTVTLNGASLTVAGTVSGSQSLTKAGSGALSLSGANTFSGGVTVSAGQLNINSTTALGTGVLNIGAGTSIDNTSGSSIIESNNNVESWNGNFTFVGSYGLNLGTGAITLASSLSLTTSATFLTISGVIGDSGNNYNLTKAGAGTLAITAANTLGGGFNIAGGMLTFLNGTLGSGNISFTGSSTLQWNGTNTQDVSSKLRPIPSGVTATFDTVANSVTLASAITGAGGIKKAGTGTLTLSAANSFAGGLTLSAGQINLNSATAPGSGTFTISGGIIDNTSGAAVTLSNNNPMVWGAGFTFTGSNALNLGTGAVTLTVTPTVTTTASNLTVGGVISGAFGLIKSGTNGMLTLSGANTYSGTTVFSSGTIAVNNAAALGTGTYNLSGGKIDNTTGSAITLSGSNPINFTASSTFVGSNALTLGSGVMTMTASVTLTDNASVLTIPGVIAGAFSFTKAGNGALALSGNSTFSGGLKLTAGTLNINSAAALGTGTFTPSGGTIDNTTASPVTVNNPVSVAGTLTFNGTNSLTFATGAFTLSAARTITVTAGTLAISSVISDGGSGYKLTVAGSGALLLSGSNTFSGGVGLSVATLDINSAQAIGTGALTITSGTIDNTSGNPVTLSTNNTQNWGGAFVFGGHNNLNLGTGVVTLSANATANTSAGTLIVGGAVTGTKSLTKLGSGTLVLSGASNYSGGTTVSAGTLVINNTSGSGTGSAAVAVSSGAILTGSGNVSGAVTVSSGGNLTPGWGTTAIFSTGNLSLSSGSNLNILINGNTAGTGYGQVNVTGTVSVSGAYLNLSGTRSGHDGTILTLITNDSADAITGTFAGLSQGAQTPALNGAYYSASYTGGTGNEFTLTALMAATSTGLTSSASPTVSNQSVTFTAAVTSTGSGTPTGNVTFFFGSTTLGTVSLNGSGTASYSTTALPVGSDSITAVYAGDSTFMGGTSSAITQVVVAGPPTQLVYAHQPGTVAAGTAISPAITIDVEDQWGNIATTDNSTVNLTVASGPGAASGTLTVNAVNGVATFSNVQFSTTGKYTLTAADGSLQSATSNMFTVTAGTPRLVFAQQPSTVSAGVSPTIQVDVEDQFGNIVTTDNSTVALSVATGPGSATGTLSVSTVNGVANFSNVILHTAGTYAIGATDSGLNPATSNSFVVTAAASTQLVYAQQPSNVVAGVAESPAMVVDIEDQFGNLATRDNSTVTLSVASGPGGVTGTISIAASNGVATFNNAILDVAGTYTLSATDASLTPATSNSFTVTPAAASQLAYLQQPMNVVAGAANSPAITVGVEDQFGNLISGDSSTVTLSLAAGAGSLGGTASVAAINGVAAFNNVILDTAGTDTLSATDASLTSATSASFVVNPAASSQLVYRQQPANVTAGVANNPAIVVVVEDQFGNIVTADNSTVALSVHTGPAMATGTLSVAAVNGVAAFGNVILTTAGIYTLAATDAGLTPATSSNFTVNAAASAQLVYVQQPTNAVAGVAESPAIVVQIEDQFGNLVTGDTSTVTVAVASGPGAASGSTSAAAVNGVATLSNVIFNTAGTDALSATDAALTPATSSSFTVIPAAATQLVYAQQPTNVVAGIADSPAIVVNVEDQFGNTVTSDSSMVSLSVASGPGISTGTLSVADVNGVATFNNVILNTTGTYTLTATDGSLNAAISTSFIVNSAAASKLVFAQQPGNVTAGQALTPVPLIDIEDQFGNVITSDSSTVTLSIATGPGSIQGTASISANHGVATFSNVTLNSAGTYALRATDSSLTTATSSTFAVNPAAATQLVYSQQPTNVIAGIAENPAITVSVEDQFGNLIISDSSVVTLSIASGPGAITGTASRAASNGVATFSNVILNTAGSYTLAAADGSLNSATSNSFTVSPAAAAKLIFAQQPVNVIAGQVITPAPVIHVEDQYGNLITTDNSTVTLSVASGPGAIAGTSNITATNGVATYNNVILNTAGNYMLASADGGLTPATSVSFTVSPAAATKLIFAQQPGNTSAGQAITPAPTVKVEDQFGNVISGDSSTVTLSVASGQGNLQGTDSVNAVNGVATFSNIVLDTAGTYALRATDSSLTIATSASFSVAPATATGLFYAQQPGNVSAGVANSPAIAVQIEDQFGNIVFSDSSTVTLSVASGPGTIGGTSSIAAVNGVATFNNVILNTIGTYTLAAADGSLNSATSASFIVSAAAATQLVFTQQPTNVTAGHALNPAPVVKVEDQFGNVIGGDSSNVTIAIASGPGGIQGNVSVNAVNSVATFGNIVLNTAGTYALRASDSSLTIATSSTFTVTPAAATQLAYTSQPTNAVAGIADTPAIVVDVEDPFGNIITSDSSTVTLSLASGPGTPTGTLGAAAVNGVATFNNVILNTAGTYTLAAADGGLAVATSTSFTISPAPASKVIFAQQPGNITAGQAITPTPVTDVEDQFGNVIAGDSSVVTLSVASGPVTIAGTPSHAATNGVATFNNLILSTAGDYALTATDGALASATSIDFTVSPAAATKLIFAQQPGNVTAGQVVTPTPVVNVEDQFGNLISADSSTVTLSIASGPGSLQGTRSVNAINGVATFSNIVLNTAGTYTVRANDSGLILATSAAFTVAPAAATQLVYTQEPSSVVAGIANSPAIVVNVEDQFGNTVTGDSSTVALSVAGGPGTIAGTLSSAASNGVASFSNVILDTAGTYTLSATDGTLISATSVSFNVTPASASKLFFAQQPGSATAGQTITPTSVVNVEDQFGNIITGDSSTVTISIASGPGSIQGTASVNAVNGVATFNTLVLNTAGTYSLRAADSSLTFATSTTFTVTPAAATQLVYSQQPTNVRAGIEDSPAIVVDIEDAFGNIVTSDTSMVTLSAASGPGTPTGTLTAAGVNGAATFNHVILNTAGTYKLTATDGTLTAATSSSFTVGLAPAAKLIFAQQPGNVTAGQSISPTPTINIEDQFGNIVTSDSSTVTLSIASGPGAFQGTTSLTAVNGVATFPNLILDTAGVYTVSASDGTLTTATSIRFTVTPASSAQLVYAQQPTNAVAGVAISPSIALDIEDSFGNVVTTDQSTVNLSITGGPGVATGTLIASATNGVALFNDVIVNIAGSYSLIANDNSLSAATSNEFMIRPAAAAKLVYAQQPSNVVAGIAQSPAISIKVEDAFGNVVTSDGSTVDLSVNGGPGSASGATSVSAINGVANFTNVIMDTAGIYTLSATDASLTPATSSSFTVTPAAAAQLIYIQQPANIIAGAAESPAIVVNIEDQFGNIVTNNGSTVTLSLASGAGGTSGTSAVDAVNGVATFSDLVLDTAGNCTLLASDANLSAATSTRFTVAPAAATQLVYVQQPANVIAGIDDSPAIVVDIEDQFGNIVTSDSSTVTLAVANGPGSISGTSSVSAINGVASFSNVALDIAGTYKVSASRAGLMPVTSVSFAVTAAATSQLTYIQQPANAVAGVANSPAIVLELEDPFGNIAAADNSTVTLSVAGGPGTAGGTLSVSAVNGIATFNDVIVNTAGSYSFNATDGSLTPAISGSFTITPAAPAKLIYAQQPDETVVGIVDSPAIVLDVEDQFGNLTSTDSSTVTLSLASGPGTLSGTLSIAAVHGVATFDNVILNTAGIYAINATDGGLTPATSNSFTVTATAASRLAYVQQPTNAGAGIANNPAIEVQVEDRFGNIVSTDNSMVTLSVKAGPGSAGGALSVMAVNGLATFNNVIIDIAGTYTLSATDAGLVAATSSSFSVTAAAAAQLAFLQQPTTVTAGAADSPAITVGVEDQFGNIVTADNSTVALSVQSGPGMATGTLSAAAVDGQATFNNAVLNTAGIYKLLATDASLTSGTSDSFTVTPAASARLVYVQQPSNAVAGAAENPAIVVEINDGFGNLAASDDSAVTLTVASGPGTVGGSISVNAVNGVATFSDVTLDIVGTYTLSANDSRLTGITSSSFVVTAAASAQLVYVQQPANVVAGVAESPAVMVSIEDRFGNLVDGDTSTIAISVGSGPGSALGTLAVAAVDGTATFNDVSFDIAGRYTLTASSGSLTPGTSANFNVVPSSASQLVFAQQPTNLIAGQTINPIPTVTVEDQFGNIVYSDGSTVTLSIGGPGSVRGALSAAAVNGVAAFNNLELDTAGVYSATATDAGLTPVTSGSFTVSPAGAAKLMFSQQPANVVAGVADSPAIVVTVEDQFGNLVGNDSSTVTLSVANGPGSLTGTVSAAAVSGTSTFNQVTLNTSGTYTLLASDGRLTQAESNSLIVSPAAPAQLAFVTQPTDSTAGAAVNPAIQLFVEDPFGNLVYNDGSTVTISVAAGPGGAGGTLQAAAVNGIATISNLVLVTAGAYVLAATDGSLTAATSTSFVVSPAAANQLIYARQPSNTVAGVPINPSIVLNVEDSFGNIVTADESTVRLSVASGPGMAGGTLAVAVHNGVATFNNVVLDAEGNCTLQATDVSLVPATSNSFTVSPSAAAKLVYVQQPVNVVAGVADAPAISVAVEDTFGNVVATDNSSVTISVANGPGTFSSIPSVVAVNGIATFSNAILDTAGVYTLSANDYGLVAATSTAFTVSPAAPAQIIYAQQPITAVAGVEISPAITVKIEDQFSNVVTTDSSTVTLSIVSGPGMPSGTQSAAAVDGVAAFPNLTFDTAGVYSLLASDSNLSPATSASFTITPAVPSQLIYEQQPSDVIAGVANSPAIQVAIEDRFGNIDTSDNSTVTLSSAAGPGMVGGVSTAHAIGGVATFSNVILNTAGTYRLSATDANIAPVTSVSFSVAPAFSAQLVFVQQPTATVAGLADSPAIQVEVLDEFGNVVTADNSTVTLSVATGPANASGTLSVAAINGIASFVHIVFDTAGTYALEAADVGLSSATSNSFHVTSASAAQLVCSQQPSDGVAGVANQPGIVVNVEDQFGNIVGNDSSSVMLSVASGPGTLSGTVSADAVNGMATFEDVVLNRVGTYTLSATDASLAAATSISFTIAPAAAAQLIYIRQPSDVTAGVTNSPVILVEVEDQFGNLVDGDSSTVTLSIASGPGSIGGTPSVNAVGGVATFDDVILDTAGTDTLTAYDAGLSPAISSSFIVSPATSAQLGFSQQPSDSVAGVAMSPAVMVDIEDEFGNIVTTDNSIVTISVASGPGSAAGTLSAAAVGGVATFNHVILDVAGTYSLGSNDASLTPATSANFIVTSAPPAQLVYELQPSDAVAGVADNPSIVVDVEDRFGNIATGDNSTVTLSVASGPGIVSGTVAVAAVNGVATLNDVTLDTAGVYMLSATDAGLTPVTSSSFTISPAAPSQLVYVQQPTNVTAGLAISPAVTLKVEDPFGNLVSGDSSSVTLSAVGGQGIAGGSLTVAAMNGLATFDNVIIDVAGTYMLDAVDGSLNSATSSSFTVNSAAASQLVFAQQPTDAIAGRDLTPAPTVNVEDQFGNIVTGDSSSVTMSIASGPGPLLGTLNATAIDGVAVFSNLLLDTAGVYTLSAGDGGLIAATSTGFTVSAGSSSRLVFSQSPSDVLANSPDMPAIVVDVEDQFGNLVKSDTSPVTLAVASGPGNVYGGSTIPATGGIATFTDVMFDTVGVHALLAQDASLAQAVSASFAVNPDPTACTLVSSVNPSDFGQNVVMTAGVVNTVQGAPAPTGTVTFMDGSIVLGNVALDASGAAVFNASGLSPGNHPITATYANDPDFLPSTSPLENQVVSQDASQVSLSASLNPGVFGRMVTFTANVTAAAPGSGIPTGTLTFTDGAIILGTAALVNGAASLTTSSLSVGNHSITAAYTGDSDFGGASSTPYAEVITQIAAELVVIHQPSVGIAGQTLGVVQVDVEDADGNVVSGDSSSITVSSDTQLGGTTTLAVTSGVATFSDLNIDLAGLHQLSFTDGSLVPAAASPIAIAPAAAARLAFINPPQDATIGASLGVINVAVEDIYGNLVTVDTSTVSLSGASLSGASSLSAQNGIAEFNNLSIGSAGQYTLTATDGALTPAIASPISVSYPATAGGRINPIQIDVHTLLPQTKKKVSRLPLRIEYEAGNHVTLMNITVPVQNGTATIKNLKFNKAGTYTLIILGIKGASITRQITVAPAAPFKLAFVNSSSRINGTATFEVEVVDRQGNLCTSDNSTMITLTAGSRATVTGGTSATVVNGIATFNSVQMTRVGKGALVAQAAGLNSAKLSIVQVFPH